jgi:hypothetical protein
MRVFLLGSMAALALMGITAVVLDRATVPVPDHVDMERRLDGSDVPDRTPIFRRPQELQGARGSRDR